MTVIDFLLWFAVQMPLMVLLAASGWIYRIVKPAYFGVARARRWLKGEAIWKPQDRELLGVMDPKEIERIEAEKVRAQVWRNELADHARGCDQCWPAFVQHHYFCGSEGDERGCDIGKMLRKRANEALSIAA